MDEVLGTTSRRWRGTSTPSRNTRVDAGRVEIWFPHRLRDSGAVLGALTNAAVAYAEAVLLVNNARGAFGSVHGADSVERAKPFPDGCLRVASDLGLEPKDCIYVGDAPTDGAAARAAGYGAAVGCSYGSHAASKLTASGHFDAVVPDVAALEKALFPDGFDDDDEALASVVRGK